MFRSKNSRQGFPGLPPTAARRDGVRSSDFSRSKTGNALPLLRMPVLLIGTGKSLTKLQRDAPHLQPALS